MSKKRQKINQTEYGPKRDAYIAANPKCRVESPECTRATESVHHKAGREGDMLTDQRYWMPSCNACNSYIEKNDAWARAHGFKLSKFNPNLSKRTAK